MCEGDGGGECEERNKLWYAQCDEMTFGWHKNNSFRKWISRISWFEAFLHAMISLCDRLSVHIPFLTALTLIWAAAFWGWNGGMSIYLPLAVCLSVFFPFCSLTFVPIRWRFTLIWWRWWRFDDDLLLMMKIETQNGMACQLFSNRNQ